MFPWNGGEKGQPKLIESGSKIMVRWQIENPVKNGMCAIRLAEQNDHDEGSYKFLKPENIILDEQNEYF